MKYFDRDNYDATDAQLAVCNAVFDRLASENPDIDQGNIADRICNAFKGDMTADELYEAARFHAPCTASVTVPRELRDAVAAAAAARRVPVSDLVAAGLRMALNKASGA
jgi:hypothetical protein